MSKPTERRVSSQSVSSDRRSGRDRREHHRVAVDWAVDYGSKDNYLFSYISDISAMGIFVQTRDPQPIGTQLNVKFTPPGKKTLELEGQVTWINPVTKDGHPERRPGMGVQFINITESKKKQIQELVQTMALLDHDLVGGSSSL